LGGKKISFDLEKRGYLKYLLFANLYFPEGISNILVPVLIPVYLVSLDFPVEIITVVVGFGLIPWIIKFLWSGIIDIFISKGRKFFVIIGGLIAVFCLISLFFISPLTLLIPFIIILFLSQIGQTLLDSAADAWGIDVSTKENRGKLNGAMKLGMVLGSGIGAIVLASFAEFFGNNYMFLIAGLIILLNLILPTVIRETVKKTKDQKVTKLLLIELKKRYAKLLLFYIPLATMGSGIFAFGIPIFASNILNLSTGEIGLIAGLGTIFAIPGSIVGGIISDKLERKKSIFIFIVPTAFLIFLVILSNNIAYVIFLYSIIIFLFSGFAASLHSFNMDATNPKIGGTQFSLYNGLANLGYIGAGTITGSIIAILGYNYMFILSGLVLLPPLIILHFIKINNIDN